MDKEKEWLYMRIKNRLPHHNKKWICEEKIPTPTTKDGCAPVITAPYARVSFANMIETAHFPRMGVIEIGRYEED